MARPSLLEALDGVTPEEWLEALRALRLLQQELALAVATFPEERLDQPLVAERPYTAYTQFIGVTQHDLYHAGQIAVLKRALASDRRSRGSES